jgi:lipopolysaccharide/colanic/teichoic acid biosynthesis glycosyltransferase
MSGRRPRPASRALDAVAAATGLVVLSPVLGWVAWRVRRELGPPVLFRDIRAGRDGVPFTLHKFRTMLPQDPEAPRTDAERLTPFGARLRSASLDELPQLWDVLRGRMALVGPRPLPVRYVGRYDAVQRRRLEVRPGITGWAQVHGRNSLDWPQRLALDVWYVDHAGLALDLRILGVTVRTVLSRHGVSAEGEATMREFLGSGADASTPDEAT